MNPSLFSQNNKMCCLLLSLSVDNNEQHSHLRQEQT